MIEKAVTVLRQGGVIAVPTEAVYGLSCDPRQDSAIHKILAIKGRVIEKGLLLVASNLAQCEAYAELTGALRETLAMPQPHPTTWLLPVKEPKSELLTGLHEKIAIRITTHPVLVALCDAFGGALVSTSANRSGEAAMNTALELSSLSGVDCIVLGALGGYSTPSIIRDAQTGERLR